MSAPPTPTVGLDGDDVDFTSNGEAVGLLVQFYLSPDGETDWALALELDERPASFVWPDFDFEQPFLRCRYKRPGAEELFSEWSNVVEYVP